MASSANTETDSEIPIPFLNTSNHRIPPRNTSSSSSLDDENPNPSSPYFLSLAENPVIVLVSQPLIGTKNYPSWSRAVFLSFSVWNRFGFVNGSNPMPEPSSPLPGTDPIQPFFHR